jgi:hypothetical protein
MSVHNLPPLVAFAGVAGAGKDEAAKALIERGYHRACFGDVIKRQCNDLIRQHFGFSAFTENRDEKARIRRTLEAWGEDNYDAILCEFLRSLPGRCVNTRLVRTKEAQRWRGLGGVLLLIERPGVGPATAWEGERLEELKAGDWIDATLMNSGTVADLHSDVLATLQRLREVAA